MEFTVTCEIGWIFHGSAMHKIIVDRYYFDGIWQITSGVYCIQTNVLTFWASRKYPVIDGVSVDWNSWWMGGGEWVCLLSMSLALIWLLNSFRNWNGLMLVHAVIVFGPNSTSKCDFRSLFFRVAHCNPMDIFFKKINITSQTIFKWQMVICNFGICQTNNRREIKYLIFILDCHIVESSSLEYETFQTLFRPFWRHSIQIYISNIYNINSNITIIIIILDRLSYMQFNSQVLLTDMLYAYERFNYSFFIAPIPSVSLSLLLFLWICIKFMVWNEIFRSNTLSCL